MKVVFELARDVIADEFLNLDLNLGLEIKEQDVHPKGEWPAEEEFDLEQIKDFVEEYVGLVITDFSAYSDDIKDLKPFLVGHMLTSVCVSDNSIEMEISTLSGSKLGLTRMEPTLSGQFAEKSRNDYPTQFSRYRISFYGGESIEYLDEKHDGRVTFHNRYRG